MDLVLENVDMTTLILEKVDRCDLTNAMLVNKAFWGIASTFEPDRKTKLANLRNALIQRLQHEQSDAHGGEADMRTSMKLKLEKQRWIHTFLETILTSYFDLLFDPVVSDSVYRFMDRNPLRIDLFPFERSDELRAMQRVRVRIGYRLSLNCAEKETVAVLRRFAQTKIADPVFQFSKYRKAHLVQFVSALNVNKSYPHVV
jgi:hypothetical protein